MTPERQKIFVEWMAYRTSDGRGTIIARSYIAAVMDFLEKAETVTKRGYMKYRKANAAYLLSHPCVVEGLCDFLDWKGIGFDRIPKKKEKEVEPLKQKSELEEQCKQILRDFMLWLPDQKDYSPRTMHSYYFDVKQFFKYTNEFNQENCRRYLAALEDTKLSPKTINHRILSLRKLGEFLHKPVQLKRRKVQENLSTENIPTQKDYERLLDYLSKQPDKKYYFWIKTLAGTGARLSEFMQFTWEDIVVGEVTLKGKGSKYRRFFFSSHLQKEVREYLKEHPQSGPLLTGRFGLIGDRSFRQWLQKWGAACGIDKSKMHPHAFRHYFAKMYLTKTKDVIQLADFLGHESVDTTRLYLRKNYDEQKRDFNRNYYCPLNHKTSCPTS